MKKELTIGIGEILWDIYPEEKFLGGAVSNTVFHLKQLGHDPILISRIGKDELGDEILDIMQKHKLNTGYIQIDHKRKTGTVGVKLKKNGVPQFNCMKNASFDYLSWTENLEKISNETNAVIFGSFAQRNNIARTTIFKFLNYCTNSIKVCDINLRQNSHKNVQLIYDLCRISDILKLNDNEFKVIKNNFLKSDESESDFIDRFLKEFEIKILLVTLGEKGCAVFSEKKRAYEPGYKINPVDTTGSGDAFTAGFVSKYLKKESLEKALEFANQLAACVATLKGATPSISEKKFNSFIRSHKKTKFSKKFENLTRTQLFGN